MDNQLTDIIEIRSHLEIPARLEILMDSDSDAIEAFQKALLEAQDNSGSNQILNDISDGFSNSPQVFSGSVSPDDSTSTQSNSSFLTVNEEKENSSLPPWALFMMGMIVLPIITGLISFTLIGTVEFTDDWGEYSTGDAIFNENVTIQDEIYYVHEFHLGDGFGDELAGNHGEWEIFAEGQLGNDTLISSAIIRGGDDVPNADMAEDDDGNLWYKMEIGWTSGGIRWTSYYGGYCEWEGNDLEDDDVRWWCKYEVDDEEWYDWWYYCEHHDSDWHCTDDFDQREAHKDSAEENMWAESGEDAIVYIKLDGDEVDIATKNSEAPRWVGYYGWEDGESDATRDIIETLAFVIWPISFIGGIIWGFATDKKPFAYGIMAAGVLSIVLPFVGFFLLLILFGF